MNYRYSPLTQIDRANVGTLQLIWARAMEPGINQSAPLVHDGVMFVPNPFDVIQALDASNGDLIWEHRRELPEMESIMHYALARHINPTRRVNHQCIDGDAQAGGRRRGRPRVVPRKGLEDLASDPIRRRTGGDSDENQLAPSMAYDEQPE